MKCEKCGTEFESAFCPNCGTKNSETVEQVSENKEINPEKSTEYYEALKKIESEKEEKEKKKKRKKRIGCLIPVIILVALIVIGIIKLVNPTISGEAENINFVEVRADYSENAKSASDKYEGKNFIFYFTPYDIGADGICQGTLYDSNKNKWQIIARKDSNWNVNFGDSAKELEKGKTYKIEGIFNVEYDDADNSFWHNSIYIVKIINE